MCKLKPGPRCARHTLTALRAAVKECEERRDIAREAASLNDIMQLNTESSEQDLMHARSVMRKALDSLEKSETAVMAAQAAFDSTPTGQRVLQEALEGAVGDVERARLQERLDKAIETHETQMTAHRLQTAADRAMSALDGENADTLRKLSTEVAAANAAEEAERKSLTAAVAHVTSTRMLAESATNDMQAASDEVVFAHARLRERAFNAYVSAGVSPNMAAHYADDTVGDIRTGWQFVGDGDTRDRIPKYGDNIQAKTKGEGHEHYEATNAAAVALQNDEAWQAEVADAKEKQDRFQSTFANAHAARATFKDAQSAGYEQALKAQSARTALREAADAQKHFAAKVGSGLLSTDTYPVDNDVFVKSAYRNADGSTNARVLVQYGGGSPYYARVVGVGRTSQTGGFVALDNGTRVHASELSSRQLLLTRPEDGATKLLG